MIPQARIDEIAAEAVHNAIQDLLDDRMGQGELLSDDLPEETPEDEQEKEMDRLEAAIRLHLPGNDEEDDEAAPDVHCTVCGGIVLCSVCGDVIHLIDGTWKHRPGLRSPHDPEPANLAIH